VLLNIGTLSLQLSSLCDELALLIWGRTMSDIKSHSEIKLAELFSQQMEIMREQIELLKRQSREEPAPTPAAVAPGKTRIAVIGMAGRFPGARNVAEFWQNLNAGVESITTFRPDEIDPAVPFEERSHPNYGRSRGVLEDADKFDAEFFRINPREAKLIDPQQRVFLEVAYEALQDAGYDPDRFPGEIGVYGGIGDNYYHIHNVLDKKDLIQKVGSLAANVGNMKDYVATRVSYKLNLRGPSISLNTACSTSLVAVDQAVLGLRNHTCDIALAGASSIYVPQKAGFMHGPGLPFASDGHIRPFSSDATGVMFSDGAGIVVLKRLDDAIRDRDHIYGVIIGSAINNDGLDKMSFFAPSAEGQTKVITKALKDANVSAETLSFIEAHATGTLLGDPVEFEGLKAAFAPFTQKKGFCALGAFKGNIGHTDAAAGVTGLIKALLALKHKKLPPNINFKNANPAIDLEHSPFYIPTAPVPLTAGAQPIRAGISAFGFGGTNAHVIIEEAPAVKVQESRKPAHILLVSGETSGALERNAKALAEHLNAHPSLSLPALEYTLAAGRKSFAQRRFLVASTLEEARETFNRNELSTALTSQKGRALAFMFPGQGTQSLNMGKALYENEAVFRKAFDSCADILQPMLGLDLRTLVYPSQELEAAAEQQLAQTCYAQPALFTIQYALAQYFLNLGLKPQAMVGHSLGEFTCATLSGVLDLKDALFLVAQRGKLMQSMAPGSMLSVNLSEADARLLLDATIDIAAINGPRQCVLAGSSEKLSALKVELEGKGIGCRPLKTSHAFHSPTVDAIQSEFIRILNGISLKAPRTPYVSTLTATWITAEQAQSPGYWAQHMRQAVRFYDSIQTLWATQPYLLLELGPRDTATVLARKAASDPERFKAIPTLTGDDSYRSVLHAIGQLWSEGASLDWDHYFAGQSRQRIPLPTYSFEKVSHWLDTIPADGKPATPIQYEETKEEPQKLVIAPGPVTTAEKGLKERIRAIFIEASGMSMSPSHDDLGFLELGLDSLTLTQVSASLKREFRVDLPQGLLLKQENTLNRLTTWLEARVGMAAASDAPSIIHVPQSTKSLASFSQRRMWMHAQVNPEATTYNIPIYFSIQGALDARILADSLDLVISRHDVLRSSYHLEEDRIYQKVSPSFHAELDRIDLSHLPKSEADAELHKRLHQLGRIPFRLDQGTLIRFHLFKINAEDHVFLLNAHHIVFDLISIQRFLTEVGQAYKNLSLGLAVDRSKPRLQYADFVAWQKTWAESGAMDQQIAFWQKHLGASALPILKLPTDHARPKMQSEVDRFVTLTLPKEPLRPLWELAAKTGATPFMLMLAAYQYLLMLLSGQRDLVVGTTIASRTHPDTQDMIGFFANTLALRSGVSEHTAFLDFLGQIKDTVLAAFDHQDAPLDEVMRKLELRRDPSVNPLFQTFFSFEKVNKETYDMGSIRMKFMGDVSRAAPATDLNIWVEEHPEELRIVAEYSKDLFQAETVAGFMQVFDTLMKKLAANPLAKLEDLKSLLAPAPMPVIVPTPPMDEAESTFKNLIQDILGLTHVDMSKSFPYHGGHSLLAIRLIEKIKQTYDVDVELKDILKAPALQQILDAIQLSQAASHGADSPPEYVMRVFS
jgi:acyl transferase domain-containing protein